MTYQVTNNAEECLEEYSCCKSHCPTCHSVNPFSMFKLFDLHTLGCPLLLGLGRVFLLILINFLQNRLSNRAHTKLHRCLEPPQSPNTKGNTLALMISTFASQSVLNNRVLTVETSVLKSVNIKSSHISFSKNRPFYGHAVESIRVRLVVQHLRDATAKQEQLLKALGFGQGIVKQFYNS